VREAGFPRGPWSATGGDCTRKGVWRQGGGEAKRDGWKRVLGEGARIRGTKYQKVEIRVAMEYRTNYSDGTRLTVPK
jgi:hypothetical protein